MSSLHEFTSLPCELYQHILSFVVDWKTQSSTDQQLVATFQSLSKKINNSQQMQEFFDNFWWNNSFERYIKTNLQIEKEFENLRLDLIRNQQVKRKILLTKYIMFKTMKIEKSGDYLADIKVVVVGSYGVGKSALTIQFVQNIFVERYDPTIEDSYRKKVIVDGIPVIVDVLDTAQEEFNLMVDQYYRNSQVFIGVCSVCDKSSIHELGKMIRQVVLAQDREFNDMPIIFSINKIDLVEDSDRKQVIEEYTNEINSIIQYHELLNTFIIESSGKTKENVDLVFEQGVRRFRLENSKHILALLKDVIKYDSKLIKTNGKKPLPKKKCLLM